MVHHVLLAGAEVARAACCGVVLGEGGGVPLLQAAFRFRAVEAEEEDVFVCYFWWEGLGVLEFGGLGLLGRISMLLRCLGWRCISKGCLTREGRLSPIQRGPRTDVSIARVVWLGEGANMSACLCHRRLFLPLWK